MKIMKISFPFENLTMADGCRSGGGGGGEKNEKRVIDIVSRTSIRPGDDDVMATAASEAVRRTPVDRLFLHSRPRDISTSPRPLYLAPRRTTLHYVYKKFLYSLR